MLEISELTAGDADFAACFAIRLEVFVGEQNVPLAEERDELDPVGRHFLARLDGAPMATLRLIEKPGFTKVTRVAVRAPARGTGLGAVLMRHAEQAARSDILLLDGQIQAVKFYEKLGYECFGEAFMEAGIAHRHMKKLKNTG